jgi:putative transposase
MVEAVRSGRSHHDVAREFHVSPSTVHHWVHHAHGQRLDRVDWSDRSRVPRTTQRTEATIEELVLEVRRHLQTTSDLGFHGAATIRQALDACGVESPPSVRTINRILRRRGVLDGQPRVRRPPPPLGWYLPQVAARGHELDSFDVVEGLVIKGGPQVEVLNGVSLHGGLVASWPVLASVTAKLVVECLVERWQEFGLPGYAQFDNDTVFQGTHAHPDAVGRVSRLCLSLGVVPVFVPPREPGFQAAIERYNGSWQAKVWSRFEHDDLSGLQGRSRRHVAALRRHRADRIESAPSRRAFPERWSLDLQARLKGRIVYLRRTDAAGAVEVLGRSFEVDQQWVHRLVRAEVDLDGGMIRFYRLRRREPGDQPVMREVAHRIKHKRFCE